mgnify:CR=1 FL=1
MSEITINIGNEFSKLLGGGKKGVVKYSGEEFREEFLDNNFETYDRINIELDGVLGYPWDFLDQSFAELARKYGRAAFLEKINFIARDSYVIDKINHMIDKQII